MLHWLPHPHGVMNVVSAVKCTQSQILTKCAGRTTIPHLSLLLCGFHTLHGSTFTCVSLYRSRVFYYPTQMYITLKVQWFDICCSFVYTVYSINDIKENWLSSWHLILEIWKSLVRNFLKNKMCFILLVEGKFCTLLCCPNYVQ